MPERVQLRRTKGWKMPSNTVRVCRPTEWGNPFTVRDLRAENAAAGLTMSPDLERGAVVSKFREYCPPGSPLAEAAQRILRGKNLACFCPLDQPCHADVLLELANR